MHCDDHIHCSRNVENNSFLVFKLNIVNSTEWRILASPNDEASTRLHNK